MQIRVQTCWATPGGGATGYIVFLGGESLKNKAPTVFVVSVGRDGTWWVLRFQIDHFALAGSRLVGEVVAEATTVRQTEVRDVMLFLFTVETASVVGGDGVDSPGTGGEGTGGARDGGESRRRWGDGR